MRNRSPVRLEVCADCVYVLANGADDENTDPEYRESLRACADRMDEAWDDNTEITLGRLHDNCDHDDTDEARDLCEEPWFSWRRCDGCHSSLGGDREYATAWVKEES